MDYSRVLFTTVVSLGVGLFFSLGTVYSKDQSPAGLTIDFEEQLGAEEPGRTLQLLHPYLSETGVADLRQMVVTHGALNVRTALSYFEQDGLPQLIRHQGEELFTVLLNTMITAHDHLRLLHTECGLNPRKFSETANRARSRLTGAVIILDNIPLASLEQHVRLFKEKLSAEVFLQALYEDPYLLASALQILTKRDPGGEELEEFFNMFADRDKLCSLFRNDLPGMVVIFSTFNEFRAGSDVPWATELLSVTDEHLERLMLQKPANLAYVLYGGYKIGITNFKKIIHDLGPAQFRQALDDHSAWLGKFFAGMDRTSLFSIRADFAEVRKAEQVITENHPYLLRYDSYKPPAIQKVIALLNHLPKPEEYLLNSDKNIQTRVYLLSLLCLYQNILHENIPDAVLSPLQFDLLKLQILHSTRFTQHMNNMMSNFEVGLPMVENNTMETIVLLLAHELSHQIYSISGFDAPLLSSASIHECCADIGALAIGQRLGYKNGVAQYAAKYQQQDDYSNVDSFKPEELISHGEAHKIGRTQLGYIIKGLNRCSMPLNWQVLFAVNAAILSREEKIKHEYYVRDTIGGYAYYLKAKRYSSRAMLDFLHDYQKLYAAGAMGNEAQIVDTRSIEQMIHIARSLFPTHIL